MGYQVSANVVPEAGPRLLGQILASGVAGPGAVALIAAAIELDAMQARQLPSRWKGADEDLANIVFAIEDAWRQLRSSWLAACEAGERIAAASADFKVRSGVSRHELVAGLVEIDRDHGGPNMRRLLVQQLEALVDAHRRLPAIGVCGTCGHFVSASLPSEE